MCLLYKIPHPKSHIVTLYKIPDEIDENELEAELAGLDEELEFEVNETEEVPDYLKPSQLPR